MLPLMEAPSAPLWWGFFLKVWTNYRGRCRNVSRCGEASAGRNSSGEDGLVNAGHLLMIELLRSSQP
jgi:hypothetical protein